MGVSCGFESVFKASSDRLINASSCTLQHEHVRKKTERRSLKADAAQFQQGISTTEKDLFPILMYLVFPTSSFMPLSEHFRGDGSGGGGVFGDGGEKHSSSRPPSSLERKKKGDRQDTHSTLSF